MNIIYLDINAKWAQIGLTVAGDNGRGDKLDQLRGPYDVYIDDDQNVYVLEYNNSRIVEWKSGAVSGQIVVGKNKEENQNGQIDYPTTMIVDRKESLSYHLR